MKAELQSRIRHGQEKVDRLSMLVDRLPKGDKREELGQKSIRVLQALASLEDGFIELYPGICLYADKRCQSLNKGTFHCKNCGVYLDTIYNVDKQRLL